MKKLFFLLLGLTIAIVASAEPADPTPITVTQPSGETLLLRLVGDEFYHFNTTSDGYTILNVNGRWEYAIKKGERLTSTGVMAHDPEARNAQELLLLESMPKCLVDKQERNHAHKARLDRDTKNRRIMPTRPVLTATLRTRAMSLLLITAPSVASSFLLTTTISNSR